MVVIPTGTKEQLSNNSQQKSSCCYAHWFLSDCYHRQVVVVVITGKCNHPIVVNTCVGITACGTDG